MEVVVHLPPILADLRAAMIGPILMIASHTVGFAEYSLPRREDVSDG